MGRCVSVPRANDCPPATALAGIGPNEFGPNVCVVPAKAGTQRRLSKDNGFQLSRERRLQEVSASRSFVTLDRLQSDASGDSGRWLRRDIGAVEIVMRRRVHLVTLDFLAHGLEANRVSNGDPRRF